MKCFVTGAAGFIGSSLADRLLAEGHTVVGHDNFSTGLEFFIAPAKQSAHYTFVKGDLLDLDQLKSLMDGVDIVFHLAANADVRFGTDYPRRDLEQNTIATWNVLEAMRANGVKRIGFSSTGSIYGEAKMIPTPEDCPFPVQTSLYGASKLAAEGMIAAYAEGFGFEAFIFRFVSILGERYTHGHIFDFYRKLLDDPTKLHILGNGEQRKSYLYIGDCLDAILMAVDKATDKVNIFNLGTNEYCRVLDSVGWICGHLGVRPELSFSGGERGWIGDNPFILLDCNRMRALGWEPKWKINEAVIQTLKYLESNQFLLGART